MACPNMVSREEAPQWLRKSFFVVADVCYGGAVQFFNGEKPLFKIITPWSNPHAKTKIFLNMPRWIRHEINNTFFEKTLHASLIAKGRNKGASLNIYVCHVNITKISL